MSINRMQSAAAKAAPLIWALGRYNRKITMQYDEETLEPLGIIYATVTGTIDSVQLAQQGKKTRQRAHDSGMRFLLDITRATGFPTVIDSHTWFDNNYDAIELHLKLVPTAHLCSPNDIGLMSFVETSWTNRGAIVRAFTDRKAAIEWLASIRTRTP